MPLLGLYCTQEPLAKELENTIIMLLARQQAAGKDGGALPWADYELRSLSDPAAGEGEEEKLAALFLFCRMPQTAFDVAERLWKERSELPIIFIAARAEEVFPALAYPFFHVVRAFALEQDMQAVLRKLERARPPASLWRTFQGRDGVVRIRQKEILYLESERHEIRVHGEKGIFNTSETLTQCEEKLRSSGFVRIHKSYLVNLYHVERMERESLVLDSGERLFISRYRYPEVKSRFERYMRRLDFI